MKIVDELPPIVTRTVSDRWKPLLDGQAYLLEKADMSKNPSATASSIRTFAVKNGMRAAIRLRPEGLYVQLKPRV